MRSKDSWLPSHDLPYPGDSVTMSSVHVSIQGGTLFVVSRKRKRTVESKIITAKIYRIDTKRLQCAYGGCDTQQSL